MINITDKAIEQFKEILKNGGNNENTMLRVAFGGFG
jgi:Fe-S cluster assembly iron-binding protein IscA